MEMDENDIARKAIGCAIDVHKGLGPGLLETVYQECLYYKLRKEGLWVLKEVQMPVFFEGAKIDCSFRIDLIGSR